MRQRVILYHYKNDIINPFLCVYTCNLSRRKEKTKIVSFDCHFMLDSARKGIAALNHVPTCTPIPFVREEILQGVLNNFCEKLSVEILSPFFAYLQSTRQTLLHH